MAAVASLALGGCYGATALETDGVGPETILASGPRPGGYEPVVRMGGEEAPAVWFRCGDAAPAEVADPIGAPGWFSGRACGHQTAWGALDVPSDGPDVLVTFLVGAELVDIAVVASDGSDLAELGADALEAVIPAGEGRVWLAATAVDPERHGFPAFSGAVELLADED